MTLATTALISCAVDNGTSLPTNARLGSSYLVVVEGDVQLKRSTWSDFHPVVFGTTLNKGDQIQLKNDSKATVLCGNLTSWNVPSGAPVGLTNGCPDITEQILKRSDSGLAGTRGTSNSGIPYIIRPRATRILTTTPVFKWNSVPSAIWYSVQVRGEGVNWKVEVTGTEVIFPKNLTLIPDQTYSFIVIADTGVSSADEDVPGLGFSLLSDSEQTRVKSDVARLESLKLSKEAGAFVQAQLYDEAGLTAEAIDTLEQLVAAGSRSSTVYKTLGDMYFRVKLPVSAEQNYSATLELSYFADDLEGQAIAQVGLAKIRIGEGKTPEALTFLNQAEEIYQLLGDIATANSIAQWRANLHP
jgi:hypothetical protein